MHFLFFSTTQFNNLTGVKLGSCKGDRIASTPEHNVTNKSQRKYRLGTARNNYWESKRFYGAPSFGLIFRRGLHNLIGCLASMEVS